jgi:hypothetical protein
VEPEPRPRGDACASAERVEAAPQEEDWPRGGLAARGDLLGELVARPSLAQLLPFLPAHRVMRGAAPPLPPRVVARTPASLRRFTPHPIDDDSERQNEAHPVSPLVRWKDAVDDDCDPQCDPPEGKELNRRRRPIQMKCLHDAVAEEPDNSTAAPSLLIVDTERPPAVGGRLEMACVKISPSAASPSPATSRSEPLPRRA